MSLLTEPAHVSRGIAHRHVCPPTERGHVRARAGSQGAGSGGADKSGQRRQSRRRSRRRSCRRRLECGPPAAAATSAAATATYKACATPAEVTNLAVTSRTASTLDFTWTPTSDDGGCAIITQHLNIDKTLTNGEFDSLLFDGSSLGSETADTQDPTDAQNIDNAAQAQNLDNLTEYAFAVRICNSNGQCNTSSYSVALTGYFVEFYLLLLFIISISIFRRFWTAVNFINNLEGLKVPPSYYFY